MRKYWKANRRLLKTLDELYTAEQVDNVFLARDWDNITEFDCVDFEMSGYWE